MAGVNWDRVPNLPPNLRALGNAFNARFPGRDGGTDGAWGDAAHKLSPSGHNPDDTPGSRPESEDADSIPELRAIDVDADLRDASMTAVVAAIVATPADRARLSYIIWNGRIAGDFNGWSWERYSGDNPHDKHAHFSGKPSQDANGNPFSSVRSFGSDEGDELSQRASDLIEAMSRKSGTPGMPAVPEKDSPFQKIEQLFDRSTRQAERLDALAEQSRTNGAALSAIRSDLEQIKAAIARLAAPGGGQ